MCHGDTYHKYYTPLQIGDVGNGCEAFFANIYIPAKSELTDTLQSITRSSSSLTLTFNIPILVISLYGMTLNLLN